MNALLAALITTTAALAVPAQAAPAPIAWHDCSLRPGDTEGQALDAAGVECADITVPVDHGRPHGPALTVAIARSPAPDAAHRSGALIINLGGPGGPVLGTVPLARTAMGAAADRFDLIGMDPRFAGRSTPIDCGWTADWLPRSAGNGRASFDRTVALSRDLAGRCTDDRLRHAGTVDQARDMDTIRARLGDPRLSFLGYSYGTYLGAVYTQLFPQHAGRIVLDSALDPAAHGTWQLRGAAPGRRQALEGWATWAAARDADYHLGRTTAAVLATVDRVYAAAGRRPLRIGPYALDDTVVPAVLVNLLIDDTLNGDLAATVAELAKAADGQPASPTPAIVETATSLLTGDQSALHSAQTAIMCADAAVPRDPQFYWRDIQAHRAGSPLFEPMARGITPCAFGPRPAGTAPAIGNRVPALIVQAEGDVNSQLPGARALHRALAGSRMVVLNGARTHGVYLFRGSACVDDTVSAYLETGSLPAADVTCPPVTAAVG